MIHLAWRRSGDQRRLVFGWVEIFPSCFPPFRGHPVKSHARKRRGPTFHVRRFAMDAPSAVAWFHAAEGGDLRLPADPDGPTPGDGQPLVEEFSGREPADGGQSALEGLPFLPAVQGPASVRAIFGSPDPAIAADLADPATAAWLRGTLFLDLTVHPEYLGSLALVTHHPEVRDLGSRLVVEGEGEHEVARVRGWPGVALRDYRLLAVERRMLGLGKPREMPVDGPLARLDWGAKSDRTGMALLHPVYGVCAWREPAPFLRSIDARISFVHETRRIVQEADPEGRPIKSYDVRMRRPVSAASAQPPSDPTSRAWQGEQLRRRLRESASLGLTWFDDSGQAEAGIRDLIGSANGSVTIVDAYLGAAQIRDFAIAVTGREVAVRVVTSAEHLRRKQDASETFPADLAMERVLAGVRAEGLPLPEVLVMEGQRAELHDRFLLVDGRLWFSGNSLAAIGERASLMIELPDPSAVLLHLDAIIRRAARFADWIAARQAARVRGDQGVTAAATGPGTPPRRPGL